MVFEQEVITSIRYRVDAYDEQCSFDQGSDVNTDTSVLSHVRLGSLDNIMHLSSYAKKLNKDISLCDLPNLLTKFLLLSNVLNRKEIDISYFKVCLTCFCWQSAHIPVGGSLSRIAGHI